MSFFRPDADPTARSQIYSQLAKPVYGRSSSSSDKDEFPQGYRQAGERSFWEAPVIGERGGFTDLGGGGAEHLENLFEIPARAVEILPAAAGWALNEVNHRVFPAEEGQTPQNKDLVDNMGDFVRGIPFLGDVAQGGVDVVGAVGKPLVDLSGDVFTEIDNLVAAPMNSRFSRAVKEIEKNGEDALIDRDTIAGDLDYAKGTVANLLNPHAATNLLKGFVEGVTTGDVIAGIETAMYDQYRSGLPDWIKTGRDYKKWMNDEFHFTYEQQAQVLSGELTDFDLGTSAGVSISTDPLTDLAFRVGANPTNIAFFGAGAAVNALPRGVGIALQAARRGNVITRQPSVGKILSPRVVASTGKLEGIPYEGFGAWGMLAAQAAGRVGRGYVKTGVGALALTMGMNELEERQPDIPILKEAYGAFRAISESRPLSHNEFFILASMFVMPTPQAGLSALRSGYSTARKPNVPIIGRNITRYQKELVKMHAETMPELKGKSFAQQKSAIEKEFGKESIDRFWFQALRAAEEYALNIVNLKIDPAKFRHWGSSRTELGAAIRTELTYSKQRIMKKLELNTITVQHLRESMESTFFTGGTMSGGAFSKAVGDTQRRAVFDGRHSLENWKRFESIQFEMKRIGGLDGFAPKLRLDAVTAEFVDDVILQVERYGRDNIPITNNMVNEMLFAEEAIFAADFNLTGGRLLSHFKIRDPGTADAARLLADLKILQKDGLEQGFVVPAREIAAGELAWAADAEITKQNVKQQNKFIDVHGRPREDFGNRNGMEVRMPTQVRSGSETVGYDATSVSEALANPAHVGTEYPIALGQVGYLIDDASEIIQVVGKTLQPAIRMRYSGPAGYQQGLEGAALTLKHAPPGVEFHQVVVQGKAELADLQLTRNATQFEWTIPKRLAPSEFNELGSMLRVKFGDRVTFNPTSVSVIVKNNATAKNVTQHLDASLASITKAVKNERGYVMSPVHVTDVVRKKLNKHAGDQDVVTIASIEQDAQRGFAGSRKYAIADRQLAELEGRVVSPSDLRGDAGVPPRYRTGQRGSEGSPGAGTAREDGGSGQLLEGTGRRSNYDNSRWRHARSRTDEFIVEGEARGAALGRRKSAFADADKAAAFQFPTGSTVRAIKGGHVGSIVTKSGELRLWRNPGSAGRNISQEWGDLLSESAAHASWAAVEYGTAAGRATINDLGHHGFRAFGRTPGDDSVVFLFRDLIGDIPNNRARIIPPRQQGGITKIYEELREMSAPSGQAQATQWRRQFHEPGSTYRAAAVERAAVDMYSMNDLPVLEQMAKDAPYDAATLRALEMGRGNPRGAGASAMKPGERALSTEQAAIEGTMDPLRVTYLRQSEEQVRSFVPNMDQSILDSMAGLPSAEAAKLRVLETAIKKVDPNYTLGVLPKGGTPWFEGQGQAFREFMGGKQAMETFWDQHVGNPVTHFTDSFFNPVYSKRLTRETKAEVHNQFLAHGASVKQNNKFTRMVGKYYDEELSGIFGTGILREQAGVRRHRSPQFIPDDIIEGFANEVYGPEIMASIAKGGDTAAEMLQRSASRFYRNLSKKFPAKDGEGNLNRMVEYMYGRGNRGTTSGEIARSIRKGINTTKMSYHWLRFLADPRWFALNWFESEILATVRGGFTAGKKSQRKTQISATGQAEFVNKSKTLEGLADNRDFIGSELKEVGDFQPSSTGAMKHDVASAGQMDPRSASAFRNSVFDQEAPEMVRDLIRKDFGTRPEMRSLLKDHGGTMDDLADGMLAQIGKFDEVGVRATYMEELAAMGLSKAEQKFMREMIDVVVPQTQDLFKDISHVFHGNVNRANLERLANSPLLWWPVSYQLKVYKQLADFMFKRQFGRNTNWGGTAMLYALSKGHSYYIENDEEYRAWFEEHPAAWQMGMFVLPVAPVEDVGVYMSRPGRFSSNWIGAHMGVTKRDKNYPTTPWNFAIRSMQVGPFFTYRLVTDIFEEFGQELPPL